jgi:hypothetical protein
MEQEPLIPEVMSAERPAPPNNGNGRPRGARNLKYQALERAARAEALPIVQQLIQQAKDGDTLAARIILDRIWPRPRMPLVSLNLPETRTPAELRAAMHGLLAQVAAGQVPPDAGAAIVAMMRDVLDSHRVQAFGDDGQGAAETNCRELLLARLTRAIVERERAAELPPPPETNGQ